MNRSDRRKVIDALKEAGFEFERFATHGDIYVRRSDGQTFQIPQQSPHDPRGWGEQRSKLRRLGIKV